MLNTYYPLRRLTILYSKDSAISSIFPLEDPLLGNKRARIEDQEPMKTRGSSKRTKEDKKRSDDENEDESDLDISDGSLNESSADLDRELSATNTQLFKIERKIQQGTDLSKRERRLLQNRKSALKCRLKKQQELDKMKR